MILELKMLGMHKERISDILLTPNDGLFEKNIQHPSISQLNLQCENISFTYDDFSPPVFKNLTLTINSGTNIAIVGGSGCGKTTLLKVLCGLSKPTSGQIIINGIEMSKFGFGTYRENIASVLQDDKLLSGTIEENICAFSTVPDTEWIVECAKSANIHEEIMTLPMQYFTHLSELGGSLSGGQKQRLMIARALYKKPKILFMDEATSHLDKMNEEKIIQSIAEMKITRVIVSHRQTTVDSADVVFSLPHHLFN